jgi:hypothetical protein
MSVDVLLAGGSARSRSATSSLRRGDDNTANRFTASLLLLAGVCVPPTRPTATYGQEKKQGATRPAISQEVASLEAIVPVAKDGHTVEAYVRKPPGKGPFPAVVRTSLTAGSPLRLVHPASALLSGMRRAPAI